MDLGMMRQAQVERNSKVKAAQRKLESGWKPGRLKRRQQIAATMIQRAYRIHLLHQTFQRFRQDIRFTYSSLRAFGHARSRNHWRDVDLRRMSREELRLIALSLNLPSSGKKVLLICRIQRWVYSHVEVFNLATQAAARALEKSRKAQGSVYFCGAHPRADVIDIRPLRGHYITSVAAGFDSDAVYALDSARGAAWLCRTGGLASQTELCSNVHVSNEFELTSRKSHWLASPVLLHALQTEQVKHVYVAQGHAMALTKTGEVFSWGDNAHGALGFAAENAAHVAQNRVTLIEALSNYQTITAAVGGHHSIAVCNHVAGHDGVIFSWGSNSHGQLGVCPSNPTAMTMSKCFPRAAVIHQVAALRSISVRQVACGALHSLALTSDGKVFAWGCSDGGRLGRGKPVSDITQPFVVNGLLTNLVTLTIACGSWHSACIAAEASQVESKAGRIFTWGTGIYGQLGIGKSRFVDEPRPVRLSSRELDKEDFATRIACGTHHTAVLTTTNRIYTWGSSQTFHAVPTELQLCDGRRFGRVTSLACGRNFTVFSTASHDASSYEWPQVSRLWCDMPCIIPCLNLSRVPRSSCSSALMPSISKSTKVAVPSQYIPLLDRPEPFADRRTREEKEIREAQRINDIDIKSIVHPLCRLCWRCNGFQPSPMRLWMCRDCSHERQLHGLRKAGVAMEEYEAVRKLQCLYRARRAQNLLKRAREQCYQRIFSIQHNNFFYYNLWKGSKSWTRPVGLDEDYELAIRDPDASPRVLPPYTAVEVAIKVQSMWRGKQARRLMLLKLQSQYEKHLDLKKGLIFYIRKPAISKVNKEPCAKLWDPPPLLRKRYDLGDPVEIKRLTRFANMSLDEAAQILQRAYRRHRGRNLMRRILRSRIKKLWDATIGRHYYYNVMTKESTWEIPDVLLNCDVVRPKISRRFKYKSDGQTQNGNLKEIFKRNEAAACMIQALYRRFATRVTLFELINSRYRKLMDPISGQPYYYDSVSGTTSWFKPILLGLHDLELTVESTTAAFYTLKPTLVPISSYLPGTSECFRVSDRARIKRHRRRLQRLRHISCEEAALRIQRMWRTRHAKYELRGQVFNPFEKIYDPITQQYYYYNPKTGVAKWEKPSFMLDGEQTKNASLKSVKRRRLHTVTVSSEATQILFTFMRCAVARLELHRLLRMRIQKVFDHHSRQYYYFDILTGQSSWQKPKVLKGYDLTPN
ncbi:putative regulator of chromosome condensation 1/beta-lactamase-inhibitor protein II [Plasmopara halstedii]